MTSRAPRAAIIGAGRLGEAMGAALADHGRISRVPLYRRCREKREAVVLALQGGADVKGRPCTFEELLLAAPPSGEPEPPWPRCLVEELSADDDVVVVAVKAVPGNLPAYSTLPPHIPKTPRHASLQFDLTSIHHVCAMLRDFTGCVAVTTNPVEIMSHVVQRKLPRATVVGLGVSLDTVRATNQILGPTACVAESLLWLGGEHGGGENLDHYVPLRSLWPAHTASTTADVVAEALRAVHERVEKIIAGLRHTDHDAAEVLARDVEWLAHRDETVRVVAVPTESSCVGRPVRHLEGVLVPVALPPHEEERLQQIARSYEPLLRKIEAAEALFDHDSPQGS